MTSHRPLYAQPLEPLSPNIIAWQHQTHASPSPKPRGAFYVANHLDAIMDDPQRDGTRGSDTVSSGLTSLEDDTDDLGREIYQAERDQQRLRNALRGSTSMQQPFRKARTRPVTGLTLENLERNTEIHRGAPSSSTTPQRPQVRAPSISSSGGSDPPVHPPRGWGRKGRYQTDWLRRQIASPEVEQPLIKSAQRPSLQQDGQDVDWSAVGEDTAIPSVETGHHSHQASPALIGRNTSLDRIQEWEISEDFTLGSLITSTPANISRNPALQDIRLREIESLEEVSLAVDGQEQAQGLQEDSPLKRPSSRASLTSVQGNKSTTAQRISRPKSPVGKASLPPDTHSATGPSAATVKEEEYVPPRESSPVVVVYKQEVTLDRKDTPGRKRPDNDRNDSHELLRRLARVTSSSPSPNRATADLGRTPRAGLTRDSTDTPSKPRHPYTTKIQSSTSNEIKLDEVQITTWAPSPRKKTNLPTLESTENEDPKDHAASTLKEESAANETIITNTTTNTIVPKTPVVMGAWVETPAPATRERNIFSVSKSTRRKLSPIKSSLIKTSLTNPSSIEPSPTKSKVIFPHDILSQKPPVEEKKPKPVPIKPNLPSSALAAIVERAKSGNGKGRLDDADDVDIDLFGESTIDSLEDILQPGSKEDYSDSPIDDDTLRGLELPTSKPKTEAERRRQRELRDLHQMNARLRATRTGIMDTRRGLKRVGHLADVEAHKSREKTMEHSHIACQHCACAEHSPIVMPWTWAWRWTKSLFIQRDHQNRLRLTWLGLISTLFLIWFITEVSLCDRYCHPRYATYFKGVNGWPDPNAPRMPFVTATVLLRPLKPFLQPLEWIWRPFVDFGLWIMHVVCHTVGIETEVFEFYGGDYFAGEESFWAAFGMVEDAREGAFVGVRESSEERAALSFWDMGSLWPWSSSASLLGWGGANDAAAAAVSAASSSSETIVEEVIHTVIDYGSMMDDEYL